MKYTQDKGKGHNHHAFHFDSPDDLAAAVESGPRESTGWSDDHDKDPWRGSRTMAEAFHAARYGWEEGRDMIAAQRSALAPMQSPASIMPCPTIADEGDEVLVDRYLDGDSDCFLAFPQSLVSTRGRVVCLVVNCALSGGVDKNAFAKRGAIVIALADALENAGYRVEILGVNVWSATPTDFSSDPDKSHAPGKNSVTIWTTIKRAEDMLETDRIAFCLMHASFIRRFDFAIKARCDDYQDHYKSTQGYPANLRHADRPAESYYFPALHLSSFEKALKIAESILSELSEE